MAYLSKSLDRERTSPPQIGPSGPVSSRIVRTGNGAGNGAVSFGGPSGAILLLGRHSTMDGPTIDMDGPTIHGPTIQGPIIHGLTIHGLTIHRSAIHVATIQGLAIHGRRSTHIDGWRDISCEAGRRN